MKTGYVAATITVLIWGITFVSTKLLLNTFTPVEILFIRFAIGTIALFVISPHILRSKGWKEEKYFIAAGISGIFLYYFLENISLIWTSASNTGVIVSTAPFFTALFSKEKKNKWFFIGFVSAIIGILLMSFSALEVSQSSLLGDFLSLGAAAVWGIYAILTKKISTFGYSEIQTTRRSFLYGLVFISIAMLFWHGYGDERNIFTASNMLNLAFLGIMASALCFVLWNIAVRQIGAIKTSVFIYLVPVVTVISSALFLDEPITLSSGAGTLLTLLGLVISTK